MRRSAPKLGPTSRSEDLGSAGVVPRLLLSRAEAAAALGMSLRHFQRHVQPHIRCVYSGQLRLYPVRELERWTEAQASEPATAA
jgi:hypothetical protein